MVSNEGDTNPLLEGLQTAIVGTTEPGASLSCMLASTTRSTKAGIDGRFTCSDFTLPARGLYRAHVVATDLAGNESRERVVDFGYDNPPVVSILEPKPFRGFTNNAKISWSISDADGDTLQDVTLEYRRGEGAYTQLSIDRSASSFVWDVSKLPAGKNYELRLTASDGIGATSDSVQFSIDRTPPRIISSTPSKAILGKSDRLAIVGRAEDDLSGIESIEYAIVQRGEEDTAKEWFIGVITGGFLGGNASFAVKYPKTLGDGSYYIYVRAVDAAGNVSEEDTLSVTVDTSPPHVGGFTAVYNGASLSPDTMGQIALYAYSTSTIGVSLEGDTARANLLIGTREVSLAKDIVSGLWEASLFFGEEQVSLFVQAEDLVGNKSSKISLGSVVPLNRGLVTLEESGAPVAGFAIEVSGQDSKVLTDAQGAYELVLGAGTYTLVAEKYGYQRVKEELILERVGPVHISFKTRELSPVQSFFASVWDYFVH